MGPTLFIVFLVMLILAIMWMGWIKNMSTEVLTAIWDRFARHFPRFSHYVAGWGWAGLLLAAVAVEAEHEYCVALSLVIAASSSLVATCIHWQGLPDDPELTIVIRRSGFVIALLIVAVGSVWIWGNKGDEPCSRLPKAWHKLWSKPQQRVASPPLAQPKLQLWIRSSTKTGMRTLEWTPGMQSSIVVGYARNVSPAIPDAHIVDIYFFVRDVGAAPLANLVIHPQIPPSITLKCIDAPNLGLVGVAPDECNPPIDPLPTIFPAPEYSGTPSLTYGRSGPELYLRMKLIVPDGIARFDIDLQLVADSILPTLYRAQFVPMMEAP